MIVVGTFKLGSLIGQKLSQTVTQIMHKPFDIEYIGNVPQLKALFSELQYILENIERMEKGVNSILGGASTIDEFGNVFFVNGFFEFLPQDSLSRYLNNDLLQEYNNISNKITQLYTFNEYWYKNSLHIGNAYISKKNIRSVTDYVNFGASLWQEIRTLINSNKYKEGFVANLLQNYIYYSYAIELINLINLLNKLPADIFQKLFNSNTIREGATTWNDFTLLFTINEKTDQLKLESIEELTKTLKVGGGWSVVESMFFAKRILENDLVKIFTEGLGVDFDL